jgi:hypothetical protein
MINSTKIKFTPAMLKYYGMGIIIVWSFFIGITVFWHQQTMDAGVIEAAKIEARSVFENHVIYRSWNAGHGGVYARVDTKTRPNPWLDTPERDITTPSGTQLTLINPAYMTRQINEMTLKKFGYISHITSLNPIRPANRPDTWEKKALEGFARGQKETTSIEIMNNQPYMRLMRPLVTQKECLRCHAKQGYKIGDIRGGISVAVPMKKYYALKNANLKSFRTIYAIIWFAGFFATIFFIIILHRQIRNRLTAEEELQRREKMTGIIETARTVCHELNQPLHMILGNCQIILMNDIDADIVEKRVKQIRDQVERMAKMTRRLIMLTDYETKEMLQGRVINLDKPSPPDKNLPSNT